MKMHDVLIILTLTFIQGYTDRNENNKCLIISETVPAMLMIMFAVKVIRLEVHKIFSQSDDLALHSRSQLRLKLDNFLTCKSCSNTSNISDSI